MKKNMYLFKYPLIFSSALLLSSTLTFANDSSTLDREGLRLQMIASNLDHAKEMALEEILLPRKLYILEGSQEKPSRLTLYTRNLILSAKTNYALDITSPLGQNVIGRWFFESLHPITPSIFTLTLSLPAPSNNAKTAIIEQVSLNNTTPVRLLALGDSLTRMGGYVKEVATLLPQVETVGTITYEGETIAREGRGGWTLHKYFSYIGLADYLDSPFLFPTEISGDHYKGNALDWQRICTAPVTDTTYSGLQKIARGWQDTTDYLYDEKGYYKTPEKGDVMVDPRLPEDKQWIEWTGSSWEPRMPQPQHFELNFSKYMERFASAFKEGAPTHISILLGANDFGTYDTLMNKEQYLNYLDALITSIHDYDASIKVIICTPTTGPNTSLLTGDTSSMVRYTRNMKLATYYLLKTYDNDESLNQNIYIAPLTLTLDTTNGFSYKTVHEEVNGELITTVTPSNGIHPNDYGNTLMGETLAAVIQKYRD